MQSKVDGKIGDAVLENAKKSTEGLNSFIGELESRRIWCNIWYWWYTCWFCSQCSHGKRRLAKEDAHIKTTWYH